jgi:very-short-patch-repair endonuclease
MDERAVAIARARAGIVLAEDLGDRPRVSARRAGLHEIHPRVYLARTQPEDVAVHLAAVAARWGAREVYVIGAAAIWLHGYGELPDRIELGIPQTHELVTAPQVAVRRLAASVLEGSRWRRGCRVVALEIAVIQAAAGSSYGEVLSLCEELVRSRRTTLARLRARCRRGLNGSAAVRRACDELSGGSMDRDVRALHAALLARGVTGLEVEVRFESAGGGSAYADLLHRATMTVLEVDGRLSHTTKEQFRKDRWRDRWLRRDHGAATLRIDVSEVRDDLDAVADEITSLLAQIEDERRAA